MAFGLLFSTPQKGGYPMPRLRPKESRPWLITGTSTHRTCCSAGPAVRSQTCGAPLSSSCSTSWPNRVDSKSAQAPPIGGQHVRPVDPLVGRYRLVARVVMLVVASGAGARRCLERTSTTCSSPTTSGARRQTGAPCCRSVTRSVTIIELRHGAGEDDETQLARRDRRSRQRRKAAVPILPGRPNSGDQLDE